MFNILYIHFCQIPVWSRPSRTSYKHIYARTNAYKTQLFLSIAPCFKQISKKFMMKHVCLYSFLNAVHFLSYFIPFLHLISCTCVFSIVSAAENLSLINNVTRLVLSCLPYEGIQDRLCSPFGPELPLLDTLCAQSTPRISFAEAVLKKCKL